MKALKRLHHGSATLWMVVGALLLLTVIVGGIVSQKKKAAAEQDTTASTKNEKPIPVTTQVVTPRSIADHLRLPGKVIPAGHAQVSAAKGGRITAILADKGDRVAKDDVLMRVDDRSWQALKKQASIQRREAEKDLTRWHELQKQGAVSQSDFDAIQMRRDLAQVTEEDATVHISQCEVRSPLNGTVDDRDVEIGEHAVEGVPAFKVINIDQVKVLIHVPERDVLSVKPGSAIPFHLAAVPDRVFTGQVSFVAQAADPHNHAFRVELQADNPDRLLRGGMVAEATLTRRHIDEALVVPLSAVVNQKGDHVLYVVNSGRAERRVVQLGALIGHEVHIVAGLEAGDRIVVEGQRGIQDGARLATEDQR